MRKYLLVAIFILAAVLRLYKLGTVPPSLYWDEASLGYNAYSIFKTGQDEHQKAMPLISFAAYGDYKPPGYIYAAVPGIAVFGLNEFTVRFPSALFGFLTVVLTYFLAKRIFGTGPFFKFKKTEIDVPLVATFLLAISPWHLQFSRAAFEANLGLFFSTLGIYLFFRFAAGKPFWIVLSLISFLAGMYTFTGQRLFVPFILAILFLQFWRKVLKSWRYTAAALVIFGVIFYPLYVFSTQTIEGRLRFDEVTIFKNLEPINKSIADRRLDGFTFWANMMHNRRFYVSREYVSHYLDAFNPKFLLTTGDVNPRLSIQSVGELYYFEAVFVIFGIYFLIKNKQKYRWFLLAWLLVSPLGPATARETPHALRMVHILPTFQIIAAFGFLSFFEISRFKKLLLAISAIIVFVSLSYYLFMYYVHYPQIYAGEWQYGYKQAVQAVSKLYPDADQVIVTNTLGRPYIYFLLFGNVDPQKYWQSADVVKDKFFFLNVLGFGKYKFVDNVESVPVHGKVIYVTTTVPAGGKIIKVIKDPDGKVVFYISKNNAY